MRVRCISANYYCLTKNKEYEVLVDLVEPDEYVIACDDGQRNVYPKELFTIAERKLKQMCFGEACYEILRSQQFQFTDWRKALSIESNLDGFRPFNEMSLNELKGLWTVEDVYED